MHPLKNRTIFSIILTSCLFSLIIPFVVLSYFATALTHKESVSTARKNAILVSDSITNSIRHALTNTTELISFTADSLAAIDPQSPDAKKEATRILNTFIYTDEGIYDAWFIFEKGVYGSGYFAQDFIRENGEVLPFVDNTDERLQDEAGAHWYYRALRSGEIYFDNEGSYDYGEGDIDVFTISAPIKKDGVTVGVVGMDIMRRYYYRMINDFDISGEREIMMLSQSGRILYSSNKAQDDKNLFAASNENKEKILEAMAQNKSRAFEGVSPDTGVKSLMYITPLNLPNAQQPAYLFIDMPSAMLYASANKIMVSILSAAVVAGGLLFIVILFTTRNIVFRLKELTNAANEVAQGNYDVQFGQDLPGGAKTKNEILLLQASIKKMIFQLKNYIRERQEFSNTLEQKIEERTHELSVMTEESEKAKKKAEEASRAKSDFLARMSHEIRTPINAIMGMTSIGLMSKNIEKKDYCFEKIETASNHLLGVINDILDMSKIEANKLELSFSEFEFEKMLSKIALLLKVKIDEKKQNLNIVIGQNVPKFIFSDEQHLSQVIFNLLSNAVKFTPDGGVISVVCGKRKDENGLAFIQVDVRDSGIGISKEQQAQLFQSFQQADNSISRKFGGTGLGLAISKNIVKLLGGDIWVTSEQGKGSVFSFIFTAKPVSYEKAMQNQQEAADAQEVKTVKDSFDGKRLLLVEDIDINREIVISLLDGMGLTIDSAENGSEAVEKFTADPAKYDLIFMDVQMPGIDGYEATRQIRALAAPQAKTVPIIAMTANVFKDDIDKSLAAGMNSHLGKPINIEEVKKVLTEYLG
ncbi:signal transduction histidine kinase/ActR/RegA family two-component response regulator [Elusimicrobium posterum]|uniref:hybrid sensor histidine kinase/response regulator n=1 Tax=Elusimicrobium posterum TaxID=3116653 RepID=UPI003C714AA3